MNTESVSTISHPKTGFTEEAFEAFLRERDEPSWLVERRREAFARFQAFAWPSAQRGMAPDRYPGVQDRYVCAPVTQRAREGRSRIARASLGRAELSLCDGHRSRCRGSRAAARLIEARSCCVRRSGSGGQEPPRTARALSSDRGRHAGADVLSALHAAFWSGGTLLYVPKGVKLDAPLCSLATLGRTGRVDLSHTLVVLEEGAEAALVRETSGQGDGGQSPGLHVGALEVFVAQGPRLRLVNIQNWDSSTWHFSRERAIVGRDASLQWTVGGLGSRLSKVNQEVALAGQGARAQVNGVMFTTGRQHLAYFTRQDHMAPHTTSDLLYKAGLKDKSRIVWKGMIRVEKDAQRTDAYQKNDNLVLSHSARADSIPGLEIEANDVRCTHGATAGRVDEEMIFYAQARAIPRETAVRLIVEGFFANVYDRITIDPVREALRQAVETKLA